MTVKRYRFTTGMPDTVDSYVLAKDFDELANELANEKVLRELADTKIAMLEKLVAAQKAELHHAEPPLPG